MLELVQGQQQVRGKERREKGDLPLSAGVRFLDWLSCLLDFIIRKAEIMHPVIKTKKILFFFN